MTYIDPTVSGRALEKFFERMEASGARLHCVIVYQNGKRLLQFAAEPYRCDDKRELYSLSKSFTSTAVGVLYDRGLVELSTPILSIFPEYATCAEQDPRWARMQIKHVLCMSTGHASCVFPQMSHGDDSVRAFFTSPLQYEPGDVFTYNTGATCLLAAAVKRLCGQTVPELLAETVFRDLGIDAFSWKRCVDGSCQGGTGLALSCEDIVKLGLLYQNHGRWNGSRVLSEEWTNLATSKQMHNENNGTADWCFGYGFQFWRNHREGYRADGAFGQVCAVLPERGLVMALMAETGDMCSELNYAWDFLDELQTDTEARGAAPAWAYKPLGSLNSDSMDTDWRQIEQNAAGIAALRLQKDGQSATLSFLTDSGVQQVRAFADVWSEQTLTLREFMPTLHQMMPRREAQEMRMSVSAGSIKDETVFDVAMRNTPHAFQIHVGLAGNRLTMKLQSPLDVFAAEKLLQEKG